MDLFLHGRVHESSIRNLLNEILNERGSVPVGELGKIMQEMTGTSNLSARLRSSFDGLKKFLESNPAEFTMCNDHPYNPHLFLTRTLTEAEKIEVINGIVPARFVSQNNKVC